MRLKSADGSVFCMVAEHLRLAAKLSLARAVGTEEPEVVERLVLRAGEYLDQATALKWPKGPFWKSSSTPHSSKSLQQTKAL